MSDTNSLPKNKKGEVCPSYQIPKILATRKLILNYLNSRVNFTYTGDDFNVIVDDVREIAGKGIKRHVLMDSMSYLAGEKLTKQHVNWLAWRIAGNQPRLIRDMPITPWRYQPYVEWVPVQIVAMRFARPAPHKLGYMISFMVMGGLSAGMILQKFWSKKFCHFISNELGFARRRFSPRRTGYQARCMRNVRELVTLRMMVRIDPALSRNEPAFDKLNVPSSMLVWNRDQMDHRDRLKKKFVCPQNFPLSQVPCYRCPIGYEQCLSGTHRKNYVFRFCPKCANARAVFDPELSELMCIQCVEADVMKAGS